MYLPYVPRYDTLQSMLDICSILYDSRYATKSKCDGPSIEGTYIGVYMYLCTIVIIDRLVGRYVPMNMIV